MKTFTENDGMFELTLIDHEDGVYQLRKTFLFMNQTDSMFMTKSDFEFINKILESK